MWHFLKSGDRPRRRAAVAVMTAITLVVLFIFASFAVDLGFVRAVCAEMQNAADAGALAGASALMESDGKETEAVHERAIDVIERMHKQQGFNAPEDQIIEVGTWDYKTREFTPADAATSNAFAVRVVSVRNKTPFFFAGVMGKHSTDVTREAVALGSGACNGIWGLEGVKAGSINTDSYDSTAGAYSAVTAGENGDICSGRNITAGGSFNVHGDVMPGFGYGLTVNGASGDITGYTTNNSGALPEAEVDLSAAKYTNDNSKIPKTSTGKSPFKSPGNISIAAGANLALPSGTYYLNSVMLTGGATITVSGPTTIYMVGDWDTTGGGIVNKSASPHNLTVLSGGAAFKLGGNSSFYGEVVAPNAVVTLGSGTIFYGACIGKTLALKGDATIHVDESLPFRVTSPPPSLVK